MAEAILSGNGSPNLTAPAQEVTRQAACGPKHWRQSEKRNSQPTDYAARIGLSSRSRRPRRWILSLPSATSRERTVPRVARPTDHGTLGVLDPAHITGTPEQIERAFRDSFLTLDRRINLLSLPIASLETLAIQKEANRIGQQGSTAVTLRQLAVDKQRSLRPLGEALFVICAPLRHVGQDWDERATIGCQTVLEMPYVFREILPANNPVFLELSNLCDQNFLRGFGGFPAQLTKP